MTAGKDRRFSGWRLRTVREVGFGRTAIQVTVAITEKRNAQADAQGRAGIYRAVKLGQRLQEIPVHAAAPTDMPEISTGTLFIKARPTVHRRTVVAASVVATMRLLTCAGTVTGTFTHGDLGLDRSEAINARPESPAVRVTAERVLKLVAARGASGLPEYAECSATQPAGCNASGHEYRRVCRMPQESRLAPFQFSRT